MVETGLVTDTLENKESDYSGGRFSTSFYLDRDVVSEARLTAERLSEETGRYVSLSKVIDTLLENWVLEVKESKGAGNPAELRALRDDLTWLWHNCQGDLNRQRIAAGVFLFLREMRRDRLAQR